MAGEASTSPSPSPSPSTFHKAYTITNMKAHIPLILNLDHLNYDARSIQLDTQLRTISLGDMSIDEYCNKIKSIADLLENIDAPVSNRHLVTYTLNGLSSKFDHVASVIRYRAQLPTFLETRSMLHLEENRLANLHTSSTSSSSTDLFTGHSDHRNDRQNDRRQTPGGAHRRPQ